jgi:hypothetical protein
MIPRGRRSTDYASSMPKLGATATKTVQPKFANLLDFQRFRRVLLVRVSPEIALITQGSARAEKETQEVRYFGTKPYRGPRWGGRGRHLVRRSPESYEPARLIGS